MHNTQPWNIGRVIYGDSHNPGMIKMLYCIHFCSYKRVNLFISTEHPNILQYNLKVVAQFSYTFTFSVSLADDNMTNAINNISHAYTLGIRTI